MSEITVSRPEVVNENTDVICSTSVRYRSLEYDNFPEIAYSALFDHGLASKSDQRFASIRSTGNLTFSTAF